MTIGNASITYVDGKIQDVQNNIVLTSSSITSALGFTPADSTKYLQLDGGSLNGNLSISGTLSATGSSSLDNGNLTTDGIGNLTSNGAIFINGASGTYRQFTIQSNKKDRWEIGTENTSESGSNVGSNFQIVAHNDDGSYLSTPFKISRSTGNVTLSNSITVNSNITCGSIMLSKSVQVDYGSDYATYYTSNNSKYRWTWGKDNSTESGSNAGANFFLSAYDDTVTWLFNPLTIARSTGTINCTQALTVKGTPVALQSGSDPSLKDNMVLATGSSLDDLDKIDLYSFDWNDKIETSSGHVPVGFNSKNLLEVWPDTVTQNDD